MKLYFHLLSFYLQPLPVCIALLACTFRAHLRLTMIVAIISESERSSPRPETGVHGETRAGYISSNLR